ncbi:MAG: PIN domain-containing protein [Cyanobacteria bacterium J06634_6]
MSQRRLFLDTVFIQAIYSSRDQYHEKAIALLPEVEKAEAWVTEAVLIEVGNGLSAVNRQGAVEFIRRCYQTPNIQVVSFDTALLSKALQLYSDRDDKTWGLIDCMSFVVMREQALTEAVTADEHFIQAGYQALLLG